MLSKRAAVFLTYQDKPLFENGSIQTRPAKSILRDNTAYLLEIEGDCLDVKGCFCVSVLHCLSPFLKWNFLTLSQFLVCLEQVFETKRVRVWVSDFTVI